MTYAKIISESSVATNPPRRALLPDGRIIVGDLPSDVLARLGWWPLVETPEPAEDPPAGSHWEKRYAIDGDAVLQSWAAIENPPAPPRTFSKFRLKLAIANAGFLSQFTQMLAQVEVLPGYSGADAFADAVTLDEDHPKFAAAVALAKQEFGLTDEQVEAILAASVAE